jgi:glycosyltransferase involved in cell wall biosynthesis
MVNENLSIRMISTAIGERIGGLYRYIDTLSEALRERGNDVTLIKPFQFSGLPMLKFALYTAQCLGLPKNFGNSIVHTHECDGSLVPRSSTDALITTIHGVLADEAGYTSEFRERETARVLAKFEAMNCRRASLCTAVSQYSKKRAVELYDIDPSKIEVVPPCVDLRKFKPLAKPRFSVPPMAKTVLFVGRLCGRKGLGILLTALNLLRQPRISLRVIGTGPSQFQMEELAVRLGLSKQVDFVGNVSEVQLVSYYQSSSVVCLPSFQEGFGIVAIEAQACGTPVVATRAGGLSEAVADQRLLVRPGRPEELSEALAEALDDHLSTFEYRRRCRKFVEEKFAPNRIAQKIEDVYRCALTMD